MRTRSTFLLLLALLLSDAQSFAQQSLVDYTALGSPAYAQSLRLSDEQIVQVARILDERRTAVIAAKPEDRPAVFNSANQKLADLLTDKQKRTFQELVSGGRLRFSFREEPWPNVLEWFAGQADLALVMNESPPGAFTYSDAKNHTPSQAIDLLNSVLQSKGFTLVRREKMLIVSRTSEGVPYDMVPKVTPEQAGDRGRFEYVSVLFPLEGRPVDKVASEVAAFLGTNGRATPLPATGQLMVVDTAGRVQAIRKLIDSIPKPKKKNDQPKNPEQKKEKKPAPVFQVHSAKGLDVGAAIETLKTLYGDAKFSGDGKAEQITAYTPPAKQEAITKTLAQMTKNVTGENEPRLEIYSVTEQDFDQLETVLSQTTAGIQISTDRSNGQLFVVGDAAQQASVRATLEKLSVLDATDPENSVAVYDVKPELADQVVELLKPLLPKASVVRNGRRIAVRGSKRDQQIASSAIHQLEAADETIERPSLDFYTLENKLADTYLNTVKQLVPDARISPVPNSNQLAIVATRDDFQQAVDALERIEKQLNAAEQPQMQKFDVAVNDPNRLLAMLKKAFPATQMMLNEQRDAVLAWTTKEQLPTLQQQLEQFTAILPAKREAVWQYYAAKDIKPADIQTLLKPIAPQAQFKPEPDRERVMIWGTAEEHSKMAEALSALQGDDPTRYKDVSAAYTVNRSDASTVVKLMRDLVPNARLVADDRSNKILVTAPLSEQQRIKAMIDQLDSEPGEADANVVKTYSTKSLAPSTVIRLLQPTFPEMRMTPNNRRNELATVGSNRDHERLKQAIDQLESGGQKGTVQSYDVGSANPSQVRSILLQLVPGVVVTADRASRSVIVWADENDHTAIKQAIEQFTKRSASNRKTEIYRFDRTSARAAENAFERLAPQARVSYVYGTNSVIATATDEEHKLFREIADKINGGDTESVVKVYPINKEQLNVDDVLESIDETLRSRVAMRMNEQTNSLVVRATPEDQATMKQLIDELQAQIPAIKKRIAKVYQFVHAEADSAQYILRDLFPEARFREDDQTGTLAATALPKEHEQIAEVIKQLDVPGQQSQQTTEIYRFDRTPIRSAEIALERMAPRARVSPIYGTNAVIATGTAAEHKLFREATNKINGGEGTSVTKVYPLDKEQIDVEDVLASIDDTLRSRLALRMNEQTNSLMVRGSEEDQAAIKQLIEQIIEQVPPKKRPIAKVYQLVHADTEMARDLVDDLFDDLRVAANYEAGTLGITALPEQHVEVAKVIEQLDTPGQQTQQSTEIYRFDRTPAEAAREAFERLVPRARVSPIYESNAVIATGTADEHKIFREAAEKMNGGGAESVVKVYPLDKDQIDVEDVLESIDDTLRSRVALRMNEQTNSLMVRGSEKDQESIRQLIAQIIEQVPPKDQPVARVYKMKFGSARSARYALRDLFEDATIAYDNDTETVIATATEKEQERIASVIQQMDQPNATGKSTKVYRIETAEARRVYYAISELVDDGRVTYDNDSNVVIVTTTPTEHTRVQQAIDDLNGSEGRDFMTKVYSLKSADPGNIENSLERLMPGVRVASDSASRTLIVSAKAEDHDKVADLVSKLDEAPGQESLMRAYPIRGADGQQVFESLRNTFNGNGNFSISYQDATKTLFVVATPKNHGVFSDLLKSIDAPELAESTRTAKSYPLSNLSVGAGRAAITALLKGTSPPAAIEIDEVGSSVIVVGTNTQHEKVAATLGQLGGRDTTLEVFDLDYVDPWTVESAVDSLFANQPMNTTPSLTSDYFSQRLFVRGSESQIQQIRDLLQKMGETSVAKRDATKTGGDVRTIPLRGDVNAAIQQVQEVWPRIRSNRIQVIVPSARKDNQFKPAPLQSAPKKRSPLDIDEDEAGSVHTRPKTLSRYAAVQTTTRAPAADEGASNTRETETNTQETEDQANTNANTTLDVPIVIVPEGDRVTIASTDHAALDQLEELFRALSRAESNTKSMGADFAVFLLRNTGASDVRQLLGELFEQLRKNQSGSAGDFGSGGFGMGMNLFGPNFSEVAVVADDRLNALIIHGDRKERELIEELLTVLDSEDLPNPIDVYQPELMRLENTQATRILAILRNVYKSQLSTGGGRKKVEIPEGVSSEVASVLQQINAAAGAPLLTLDVDETTNSIVMRAPPELRQEIQTFVTKLDNGAGRNRSRNVRVIQLQRGKSDLIREALEQFILDRRE